MTKPIVSLSRSFLVFFLVLAVTAAVAAVPAAAAQQSPSKLVFGYNELFGLGPVRSFEGAALKEIAFPLGGIGTGTVSLGGRGQLRDWEIFNRPGKGVDLPFTFFAMAFVDASSVTSAVTTSVSPPLDKDSGRPCLRP